MSNGWTGGQFSIFRIGLALATIIQMMAWSNPSGTATSLALSMVSPWLFFPIVLAAICLGLGWFARPASLFLIPFAALAPSSSPWHNLPLTLLLTLFILVQPGPYGSLKARGRQDPGGNWSLHEWFRVGAWSLWIGLFAVNHLNLLVAPFAFNFLAFVQTETGLPIIIALLAVLLCFKTSTQPIAWLLMFLMQILVWSLGNASSHFASFFLLILAMDPAWIPPRRGHRPDWLFYDGNCGLCHRACRFILAEDNEGDLFHFAPIAGSTFLEQIPEEAQKNLPDSMIIATAEGEILTESSAALHVAKKLGGFWRIGAWLAGLVPQFLRQAAYRFIAKIRYNLFASPSETCPVIPPKMRPRFGP